MGRIGEDLGKRKLTKKDRQVLGYLLENRETACFMTAAELAAILGVSPSSVVRAASKLGFETFAGLKKALQQEAVKERLEQAGPVPYERIRDFAGLSEDGLIDAVHGNVLRNIRRDQEADRESYKRAARLIHRARRVYIAGHRACAGFASVLAVMLGFVRPNVFVAGGGRPLIDMLVDLTPEDALVAISFERYSSDTLFAAQMAREAGSHLVTLTDRSLSPLGVEAGAVILCSGSGLSFCNSYTSLVMAMEILTGLVSRLDQGENEKRLKKMEEYLKKTGQY